MSKLLNFLHHFFVPREENNFQARSLHTDFLSFYLVLAILIAFSFHYLDSHFSNVLGFATDITINKLYALTNQEREQNGLSDLTYNEELATAAAKKAQDMFAKNYWSHYGPEGETPWDFILASGYRYQYAGENLAKNFLFSQGVMDAWMNSTSHKENILQKNYTDVGFAVVNGVLNGEETTLVVQMFGRPQTIAAAQLPKNNTPQPATSVVQPTVAVAAAQQPATVLAKESSGTGLTAASVSLNMNLIFLMFLLVAIFMDIYFAAKFKVIRITGKHLAHFIFIFFILAGILVFTKGTIL